MAKPKRPSPRCDVPILDLVIEQRPIASLKPYPRNARTHSKKQIHQIAASIEEFGFVNPVLLDEDSTVIAGHGRLEAAKLLGLTSVPAIVLANLSEAQKRALRIADNKLALNAGWDLEILKHELIELAELDLDFDLEITGFETTEIDLVIDGASVPSKADPADGVPQPKTRAVSRIGDHWFLGKHKLACADARDLASLVLLMDGERARLVFSDPPYNVRIDGHVCGAGSVKHREFAMASGEMSREEFIAFLTSVFSNMAEVSLDGAVHFQCMDWRHMTEMLQAGEAAYSKLLNLCVWAKNNGGMGSFYRSRHELVFVWKVGTEPHLNTIELGKYGRYRTNVWEYPGVNTLKPGRIEELAMHPTVKPVALVAGAIKDASRRGDVVLDCFGGSGTTLIAAEKTGRRARLIEHDPVYCDVIVRRWQRLTGKTATLAETGQSFDEVAAERARSAEPVEGDRLEEAA